MERTVIESEVLKTPDVNTSRFLHVNTAWKFREVIEFRDRMVA